MSENYIEYIGYIASALVIASFLIKNNLRKTRIVNLLGAIAFVIYGYFISSNAVIITNIVLSFVQIYYLIKDSKKA